MKLKSITDNSMATLADGTKKKIKDIKAEEEVLTLNEKISKLVPRKVNALLDNGIKPIYEMKIEDGRAIDTTAEHPYLVKKIEYHSIPNNFLMSDVESTLTLPCCLCLFSSDHNSYSSDDNVNAKYAASLRWCGNISKASGRNLEYLDSGTISIFLNNSFITKSSSALVNPLYFSSLSSRFIISVNINLGEYSLVPAFDSSLISLNINPRLINAWNTMFASTTNSILETYIPCSLAIEDLTSSANSKACSLVNLLLDTILSAKENSTSSMNSLTTLFKAASKSSFNSGEISTLNFNSAILTSQKYSSELNYINLSPEISNPSLVLTLSATVTKAAADASLYMVVSELPALIGNKEKGTVPVAFIGQVKTKVSGKVNEGDYILANGDGIGYAKSKMNVSFEEFKSKVVGIALEGKGNEDIARINVAVGVK